MRGVLPVLRDNDLVLAERLHQVVTKQELLDRGVKALKDENADLKARVIALEAQTQRLADLEAKDIR